MMDDEETHDHSSDCVDVEWDDGGAVITKWVCIIDLNACSLFSAVLCVVVLGCCLWSVVELLGVDVVMEGVGAMVGDVNGSDEVEGENGDAFGCTAGTYDVLPGMNPPPDTTGDGVELDDDDDVYDDGEDDPDGFDEYEPVTLINPGAKCAPVVFVHP